MSELRALVAPPLARMLACSRRAEGAYLSYIRSVMGGGPDPTGKRTGRGGRLNDGMTWALTAWAEIADREPLVTHQRRAGHMERVRTRPWRDGKASAWTYLESRAQDKLWGGPARQMLADLERRGITREEQDR